MKKIVVIIVLLCAVLNVFADPYVVHTTSSARVTHISSGFGMAQAPIASMSSTSSHRYNATTNYGVRYACSSESTPAIRGIRTVASSVTGGVTTYEAESSHKGHIRKVILPDVCDHCDFQPNADGDFECIYCHATLENGCECTPDCHCPIVFDWQVVLFLSVLACAHIIYKETKKSRA
ncbi:MAG: hypothetical protein IJQ95_02230 [Paludibacteraceae bacterium]|nr:hypothetical protein [Paludibacteraceae bacterium]